MIRPAHKIERETMFHVFCILLDSGREAFLYINEKSGMWYCNSSYVDSYDRLLEHTDLTEADIIEMILKYGPLRTPDGSR